MYVFELHDGNVNDLVDGTLLAHIGRRGTIVHPYQAEMHLQELLGAEWRRAYLKAGQRIAAIWTRDQQGVRYLARTPGYSGEWSLPFVGSPNATIAVAIWGSDVRTDDEAQAWAAAQLTRAITAIILDRGEIRAAWEMVNGSPRIIARGPATPK